LLGVRRSYEATRKWYRFRARMSRLMPVKSKGVAVVDETVVNFAVGSLPLGGAGPRALIWLELTEGRSWGEPGPSLRRSRKGASAVITDGGLYRRATASLAKHVVMSEARELRQVIET